MFVRSWFALLLLTSYLLIAGTGFINAPDEPRYAVAESYAHRVHHHQDRYSDFDGMDLGLDMSDLTVNPSEDATAPSRQPLPEVTGIDAHCLPGEHYFSFLPAFLTHESAGSYLVVALATVYWAVDAPPWSQ